MKRALTDISYIINGNGSLLTLISQRKSTQLILTHKCPVDDICSSGKTNDIGLLSGSTLKVEILDELSEFAITTQYQCFPLLQNMG